MKRAAVSMLLFLFGFILGVLSLFPMLSQGPDVTPALVVPAEKSGEAVQDVFSSRDTAALLQAAAGTPFARGEIYKELLADRAGPDADRPDGGE